MVTDMAGAIVAAGAITTVGAEAEVIITDGAITAGEQSSIERPPQSAASSFQSTLTSAAGPFETFRWSLSLSAYRADATVKELVRGQCHHLRIKPPFAASILRTV